MLQPDARPEADHSGLDARLHCGRILTHILMADER